jgi:hypothetical protein
MNRVSCYTLQFQYTDGHRLLSRILQVPGDADWSYTNIFYNMHVVFKNVKLWNAVLGYDTIQFCR